jgi:protein SCO1/2
MKLLLQILTLLCLSLALSACGKKQGDKERSHKNFTVKGVVIDIQDEGRTMIIDHEEMPGYMGAMTMPFRVKDSSESNDISLGDEIEFTYQVAELSSWIEDIHPTGKKVSLKKVSDSSSHSSKLLKVGDLLPDVELLDEHSEPVHLKAYRGSVVALTFIFTRCPVPEYCPTMMRNFKAVEALLATDPDAPEKYKLLTVSFDSEYDTPEVMKAYGEQYGKNSNNWNLLTSSQPDSVRSLGESVGLMFGENQSSIYSHNLRTVVLDPNGRITKIFTDETWTPKDLAKAMKRVKAMERVSGQ